MALQSYMRSTRMAESPSDSFTTPTPEGSRVSAPRFQVGGAAAMAACAFQGAASQQRHAACAPSPPLPLRCSRSAPCLLPPCLPPQEHSGYIVSSSSLASVGISEQSAGQGQASAMELATCMRPSAAAAGPSWADAGPSSAAGAAAPGTGPTPEVVLSQGGGGLPVGGCGQEASTPELGPLGMSSQDPDAGTKVGALRLVAA